MPLSFAQSDFITPRTPAGLKDFLRFQSIKLIKVAFLIESIYYVYQIKVLGLLRPLREGKASMPHSLDLFRRYSEQTTTAW